LGQADAALFEVGAYLFVLHAVEAVLFEQRNEGLAGGGFRLAARQHNIEQGLHHPAQLEPVAAGGAKFVQFRAPQG
jgi:hypothetical protein